MKFEKILPQNSKRREIIKKIFGKTYRKYNAEEVVYKRWIEKNEPTKKELKEQQAEKFKINPKISIIVPLYNTPKNFFGELVDSLKKQTYSNWELCLADGSPEPISFMQDFVDSDARIKYKVIGENKGISGNTNEALTLVTGDFIGLLDHDDLLPPFALYEVVKAINENPEVEFIYSDEDKLEDSKSPRYGVFFKPDFSPYTLNSANYICHFSIFKKELMDKLGGFKSEYDGSQDFDIVIRASEHTKNIVHIPKPLYHWRVHQNSTAGNSDSKPYAFEIGKKVIKDHIQRLGNNVLVEDGLTPGSYALKYQVKQQEQVSIIVDLIDATKEQANRVFNELEKSTYKNKEIITISEEQYKHYTYVKPQGNRTQSYQMAIEKSNGAYFFFVDENLVHIEHADFIEQLLGICQDPEVGIVGTKLFNKEKLVEHAGIILGMNGVGDFLYKHAPKDIGTYMQRLLIIHNVSCVTIKYAMMSKTVWENIGKYTTKYTGMLCNLDTCLKLLQNNKQVVINPIVEFEIEKLTMQEQKQEELPSFEEKWNKAYEIGDRYFSPNLSKTNTGLAINVEE